MKTILITGANQGIGFETAKQLAELGYYVYLGSRDTSKGYEATEKLKASGLNNVDCIALDVTNIASITSARKTLESKTPHLDILINNAGIAGKQPQNISAVDMEKSSRSF